jgi:LacI family transcriptional regulator
MERRHAVRPATLADVAKACAVSIATVSKALSPESYRQEVSPEVRQRVRAAAAALGYHGRNLDDIRLRPTLALLVLEGHWLTGVYTQLLRNLSMAGADLGAELVVVATRTVSDLPATLRRRQIQACLVTAPVYDDLAKVLDQERWPVVLMNERRDDLRCVQVVPDEDAAMDQVVDHLLGLGHRRIAWIKADPDNHWSYPVRRARVAQRLAAAGLTLCEVATVAAIPAAVVQGLTALIAPEHKLAMGALRVCQQSGLRVPEDVSLVSSSSIEELNLLNPALAACRLEVEALGRVAVERALVAGGSRPGAPTIVTVPVHLDLGASTGPSR